VAVLRARLGLSAATEQPVDEFAHLGQLAAQMALFGPRGHLADSASEGNDACSEVNGLRLGKTRRTDAIAVIIQVIALPDDILIHRCTCF